MEAILSKSAGILAFPIAKSGKSKFIDFISNVEVQEKSFLQTFSIVEDWEWIDYESEEKLLKTAIQEYWDERAKTLLIEALLCNDESLELEILDRANEIISTNANPNKVTDKLLIAPLERTTLLNGLHDLALSNGYAAITSILNSIIEHQPHINRFADIWINIDSSFFIDLSIDKSTLWKKIIDGTDFIQLISSKNRENFQKNLGCNSFSNC